MAVMVTGNIRGVGGAAFKRGLTLVEMTVVIVVLMALIGGSMFAIGGYTEWKLGSTAAVELRKVYNAQRTYLAENPTEDTSSLTAAKIIPYLSDGAASLPTVEDLDGNTRTIIVTKVPPVVNDGAGAAYDPSGDDTDGLWDVGTE